MHTAICTTHKTGLSPCKRRLRSCSLSALLPRARLPCPWSNWGTQVYLTQTWACTRTSSRETAEQLTTGEDGVRCTVKQARSRHRCSPSFRRARCIAACSSALYLR
jgi:hypothetical protein